MVVFPVPGGPKKIIEKGTFLATDCFRKDPSPSKWVCPMTSSKDCGRTEKANGNLMPIMLKERKQRGKKDDEVQGDKDIQKPSMKKLSVREQAANRSAKKHPWKNPKREGLQKRVTKTIAQ